MRNKFILLALISAVCFACELDQYPHDRIPTEEAWQTVDDAIRFRQGLYSLYSNVCGGLYVTTADIQSDLFNATKSYNNHGGDLHRWEFTNAQYDIEDIWQNNYVLINNCNNIIDNIDAIVPESKDEEAVLKEIKGEAYLMRALTFHKLVIRFARDYDPATADAELGLPLVLRVDPAAKPERATLSKTYTQILDDINNARQLMNEPGITNSFYLTVDVIDALEARVKLYMRDYKGAIVAAKKVIGKYQLVASLDDFTNEWLYDESPEILFRVFQSVDERVNEYDFYRYFASANNSYSPYYVPAQWVLDLYEEDDFRKSVFFICEPIKCDINEAEDVYMLNKYPGNPDLKKETYSFYNMAKPFRVAESYLILAEAEYKDNNEADALNYLNTLRTKRNASTLQLSGGELFKAIKEEWIREFIGEGDRMSDLKRWGDGFKRREPQNTIILMNGSGYYDFEVKADDKRMVWEIPANDLNVNKNLVGNW